MKSVAFQYMFQVPHDVVARVNVTNVCNLHCDYCDNGCHIPFSNANPRIFRRSPFIVEPNKVEALCRALVGIGESNMHIIQGGEITTLPREIVARYIDILTSFGRQVALRTNGYNLTGIPVEILNRLKQIHLNCHHINRSAIAHCRAHLAQHYHGEVVLETTHFHRNLDSVVRHGLGTSQQGIQCSHLLATLTFVPPAIYPCCNTWALMNALNSSRIHDALVNAGWTVDNPHLRETLRHWRTTLPSEFFEVFCADSCYLQFPPERMSMYPIQPHTDDQVMCK